VGVLDDLGTSWAPVIAALGLTFTDVFDSVAVLHATSVEARSVEGAPSPADEVVLLRKEVAELRASLVALSAKVADLSAAATR
jgi:hypothetical protein